MNHAHSQIHWGRTHFYQQLAFTGGQKPPLSSRSFPKLIYDQHFQHRPVNRQHFQQTNYGYPQRQNNYTHPQQNNYGPSHKNL